MFEAQQNDVFSRLSTGWGATSKIKWPGVAFKHGRVDYIAAVIRNSEAQNETLGSKILEVQPGVAIVQVFIYFGTDKGASVKARQWANTIADIFRNKSGAVSETGGQSGTIFYGDPTIAPVGERPNYYQLNVLVPFETHSFYATFVVEAIEDFDGEAWTDFDGEIINDIP